MAIRLNIIANVCFMSFIVLLDYVFSLFFYFVFSCKVIDNISSVQVGSFDSDNYMNVIVAVCERLTPAGILQKSYLQIKRNLLTFVELTYYWGDYG